MTVRLAVGHQGNRLDAQGRREPGQRPAAAGYPDPPFQPAKGGQAYPGFGCQVGLGETLLAP
jgi:hypothetical protein